MLQEKCINAHWHHMIQKKNVCIFPNGIDDENGNKTFSFPFRAPIFLIHWYSPFRSTLTVFLFFATHRLKCCLRNQPFHLFALFHRVHTMYECDRLSPEWLLLKSAWTVVAAKRTKLYASLPMGKANGKKTRNFRDIIRIWYKLCSVFHMKCAKLWGWG